MLGLVLTAAVAAPVPKVPPVPPPVEVTAKRVALPPIDIDFGGQIRMFQMTDDGNNVEVTVKNTSKGTISFVYHHGLDDCVYAKVTDAAGKEVSVAGHRLAVHSIVPAQKRHELKPGESFTATVHLTGDWPDLRKARKPGKYTARIVFEAGKVWGETATTFDLEVR